MSWLKKMWHHLTHFTCEECGQVKQGSQITLGICRECWSRSFREFDESAKKRKHRELIDTFKDAIREVESERSKP